MDPLPQQGAFTNREPGIAGLEVRTELAHRRAEEGGDMYSASAASAGRRTRFGADHEGPFADYSTGRTLS
jgi:hypothetical protein